MPHRSESRSVGLTRLSLIVAFVGLVGVAACDSGTEPDQFPDIGGEWESTSDGFHQYLEITETTITEYYGVEGQCFFITTFDVVSRSGDNFTLQVQGGTATVDVVLRREDSGLRLIIASTQQSILFAGSTRDLSTLTECGDGAGGSDPAIDCSTLPAITPGQPIDGELDDGDPAWLGRYYDLYGLTLSATQEVTIEMTSTEVDAHLYLYEADGTYIDENDDATGTTNNSLLTVTLDAGCYRIEASSFWPGEVGTYTLSVD